MPLNSTLNGSEFSTTDMGLAVFLIWKGCKESDPPWRKVPSMNGRTNIEFCFTGVDPELLQSFREDREGIQRYNAIRRTYLNVVKTVLADE